MSEPTPIPLDKGAAAVRGMIRALRLLGRTETTALHIAESLRVPEELVLQVMRDYRIAGAKAVSWQKRAKMGPWSILIELKP